MMSETTRRCEACGGEGRVEGIVGYVTRDMALDACEPDMEGMPYPGEVPCPECEGTGVPEERRSGERRKLVVSWDGPGSFGFRRKADRRASSPVPASATAATMSETTNRRAGPRERRAHRDDARNNGDGLLPDRRYGGEIDRRTAVTIAGTMAADGPQIRDTPAPDGPNTAEPGAPAMTPGSAPEPRPPFALPVRVVQPSEEARRMGRYEAVLCDANNVRIARVECFLPHDKPYHVIDATAPTADFIADAINAQPLGGAYTPPLGEPTWTDPLGMLASLCEEIRCAHRDPDDDDYNECEKDECAWCSDGRTAIDQLRLRVAPPREPHQSEETGSEADLIAELESVVENAREAPDGFVTVHLNAVSQWLAALRSRTEREAGERVEGWAELVDEYGGRTWTFDDLIDNATTEAVPATLILRSPSPRVPENEGGKP
jgi:hypothetical protein